MSVRKSGDHRNKDIVDYEYELWGMAPSDEFADLTTWSTSYIPDYQSDLYRKEKELKNLKHEQLKAQNAQTRTQQKSYSSRGTYTGGSRYSAGNRNYNTRCCSSGRRR